MPRQWRGDRRRPPVVSPPPMRSAGGSWRTLPGNQPQRVGSPIRRAGHEVCNTRNDGGRAPNLGALAREAREPLTDAYPPGASRSTIDPAARPARAGAGCKRKQQEREPIEHGAHLGSRRASKRGDQAEARAGGRSGQPDRSGGSGTRAGRGDT